MAEQQPAGFSRNTLILTGLVLVGIGAGLLLTRTESTPNSQGATMNELLPANIDGVLSRSFTTDFSNRTLDDFSKIVSGGPGKDGIPAVDNPEFEPIQQTTIADTTRGVLLDINGERRFYPYNILVWHEIVNDTIGDRDVAVTFCPLCGSAIVYDRNLDGEVVDFGVSGFLRESNMIMFDRGTESLWQQSTGEAFAGTHSGTVLQTVKFDLLELFSVKEQFPDTKVMTTNTGHSRDYQVYPYGNYDNSEDLFFEVSVDDARFPAKELFYVTTVGDKSVALRVGELVDGESVEFEADKLTAIKQGGILTVTKAGESEPLPGYYEMWFSWATWHQDDGVVWEP